MEVQRRHPYVKERVSFDTIPTMLSLTIAGLFILIGQYNGGGVDARVADRSRVIHARTNGASRRDKNNLPIEGSAYFMGVSSPDYLEEQKREPTSAARALLQKKTATGSMAMTLQENQLADSSFPEQFNHRHLSSQLSGCCSTYKSYSAAEMCALYGQECETGGTSSHDDGEDCQLDGLSFVGVSFSVNTAHGNAYSYHLNDQFPMENLIDRKYDYVMSMDEDGWLVGGGYKSFDYSGKMPYIDSSHTELIRIGALDQSKG